MKLAEAKVYEIQAEIERLQKINAMLDVLWQIKRKEIIGKDGINC